MGDWTKACDFLAEVEREIEGTPEKERLTPVRLVILRELVRIRHEKEQCLDSSHSDADSGFQLMAELFTPEELTHYEAMLEAEIKTPGGPDDVRN